jgi:hypothetical protein
MALLLGVLSFFIGIAYTPWMASFTETVEARNPALIATGLAIWGWIIRIVVAIGFLAVPFFVSSVTPLVDYGPTVQAYAAKYQPLITFAQTHPQIIATAQKYQAQALTAQKFAPQLAVLQAHPALFRQLATYPNAASIPPKLLNEAVVAAGGGLKGLGMLSSISANKDAINSVVAVAPQLQTLVPYQAQLTALSKIPDVTSYLQAHANSVLQAKAVTAKQWKHWYWVCFGGVIFFLLCIPLLRGRWRPSAARRDEEKHEAMVQAELDKLKVGV